jgi:gliding motility-associated-like protein
MTKGFTYIYLNLLKGVAGLCLLLLFPFCSWSQNNNLVQNGSFEQEDFWGSHRFDSVYSIDTDSSYKPAIGFAHYWTPYATPTNPNISNNTYQNSPHLFTHRDTVLPIFNRDNDFSLLYSHNYLKYLNNYFAPSFKNPVMCLGEMMPKTPLSGDRFAIISLVASGPEYGTDFNEKFPLPQGVFGSFGMRAKNRTLITNKLRSPLVKGKRYKLGFFASINNYTDSIPMPDSIFSPPFFPIGPIGNGSSYFSRAEYHGMPWKSYMTDGLGALLTVGQPVDFQPGAGSTEHPWNSNTPQFRISEPFKSNGEWIEFSWEFTAEDTFTYLTIGNFWTLQQQNLIKWRFDLERVPETSHIYYMIVAFIDSVYLQPLGAYLPEDTTVCMGSSIEIKDGSGGEVTWYREDGSSFKGEVFSLQVNQAVTRIVALLEGEYDTMFVFGKEPPVFTINHTDSLCPLKGKPVNRFEINSTETELSAQWLQNGNSFIGMAYTTSDTGLISVLVTDSLGCEQSLELRSDFHCICPILPPDTMLCMGSSLTVRDLFGCDVTWILEDSSEQQTPELILQIEQPVYRVVARTDGVYDTMLVFGKVPPAYSIEHTDSLCRYTRNDFNRLQLIIQEQGVSAFWQMNGTGQTGLEFASADTGLIFLTLSDSLGCEVRDTFYLGEYCPEFSDICGFPNAFSPNGDGINDVLSINCVNIRTAQITVLNRWGEILSVSENLNNAWDGTFNGKPCKADVYTVIIQYEIFTQPGKKYFYSGTLTLLR